jgi:hypothetical protein
MNMRIAIRRNKMSKKPCLRIEIGKRVFDLFHDGLDEVKIINYNCRGKKKDYKLCSTRIGNLELIIPKKERKREELPLAPKVGNIGGGKK